MAGALSGPTAGIEGSSGGLEVSVAGRVFAPEMSKSRLAKTYPVKDL